MVKKGKKRIMITVTEEQAKIYKEIAEKIGITTSAFIQLATAQYVQDYRKENENNTDIVKLTNQIQELLKNKIKE